MMSTQGKDSFIENYCLYFESIKYIRLVRKNFFKALYLAHEIEEERDEDRWELLVSQNRFLSPIKSELDKHTGCAEKMITTTLTSAILTSEAVEARTLLQSIGTLLSF